MIELENITKTYHMGEETIHALSGIDLTITEGEFVAIVGPSGSGKSTLLHIIGGPDSPPPLAYWPGCIRLTVPPASTRWRH